MAGKVDRYPDGNWEWHTPVLTAQEIRESKLEVEVLMLRIEKQSRERDHARLMDQLGEIVEDVFHEVVAERLIEPPENTPLRLEQAIYLPELLDQFSVKTLRLAIERGELSTTRVNKKNIYVTRKQIQEWITRCQDSSKTPISSSAAPVTTRPLVSSLTTARGLSSMETSKLRQDAVSQMLKKLR